MTDETARNWISIISVVMIAFILGLILYYAKPIRYDILSLDKKVLYSNVKSLSKDGDMIQFYTDSTPSQRIRISEKSVIVISKEDGERAD